MAVVPKRLAQFVATTAEVTYYTVAANKLATIKQILIANTSAAAVTLSLSVVPSGNAAGNANRIVPGTSVPVNSMVALDVMVVLGVGDFISAIASANTALTVTISGLEQ